MKANNKTKRYFSQIDRIELVAKIARAIEQGLTLAAACKAVGVSRMAVWGWVKDSEAASLILKEALKRKKAAVEAKPDPASIRPVGWRLQEKSSIEREQAEKSGFIVVCFRCGHKWSPRKFPVRQCSHPACQSVYFNCDNRFSIVEKKAAEKKRKAYSGPTPLLAGEEKRGRGRPRKGT